MYHIRPCLTQHGLGIGVAASNAMARRRFASGLRIEVAHGNYIEIRHRA